MKKITLFIFALLPSLMFSQVILQDEFELSGATAGTTILGFASSSTNTVPASTRVPDVNATGNFYRRQWMNETTNANDLIRIFDTDETTNGVLRTAGFGTMATMDITSPKTGTTYAKPTKLKMTVTFDCSTLTSNGDVGRGVFVGYYKTFYVTTAFTAAGFTDANNGITYNTTNGNLIKGSGYNAGLDFFGFIVNALTGQINLWNGQSAKTTATNAYQAYKGTWSGGTTMHTISYVVDTDTGALSDFVFDGDSSYDPWTTAQFPAATLPVFTNANTNIVGLGSISSAGTGYANFYSFKLENAVPQANTAPVAVADAITVAPGGTSTTLFAGVTSVLTNDTDAEGNPITATVVTNPANGTLTLNSNGTFSYVHDGSATTTDSFTYKANDGALDSNTATVTIAIGANNAPVANDDAFSVKQGGTVVTAGVTSVLTNDTDAEGSPLTATVVTSPANGTLTLNANGTFSYLHDNSATTTDSFTYKANDGTLDSAIATVNITITAPVATTNTWTGGTSTDFLVASNWTASDAPNPVVFSALASFTVSTTANTPVLNANYSTVSGAANCAVLTLNTGAVLTTNADITTNSSSSSAIAGSLNINAGTFTTRAYIQNGGAVAVGAGATLTEAGANRLGVVGAGTLNINGGTLNCTGSGIAGLAIGALGVLNLNSGTVNYTAATAISISTGGLINIDAGSIVLDGDQTAGIATLVTDSKIVVSGAALAAGKIISNTYDSGTGKTTVVAVDATTTWNGLAWSNGVPTASLEAIVTGVYDNTIDGSFTAKKLTVNSGSLTIKSGTSVTVQNEVINNAGANGIVVENNANLIQVNNTTNAGNIVVNRNSNALSRLDYTLWSSPVAGQNLAAFSPLTSQSQSRFYTYDTANNQYSNAFDPTATSFVAGTGYLIRMPNTAVAFPATEIFAGQFTGVPNNGDVPVALSTAGNTYNLVGNPYPSTINLYTLQANNSTIIGNTFYMWRTTNVAGTAYCTYVPTSTTAGTYVSNNKPQSPVSFVGDIQPGQGFFVTALATGPLVFKNVQRVSTATSFFRTKQVAAADKVWLNATNAAGDFSQMAVTYFDGATPGVDAFDGKYINDSPLALTSNINNDEYTIQGRPGFDASDVVPLNFKTAVAGDYTIAIDHSEGVFAAGQSVILADAATGTETDLTTSSYTFTAPTGTANSRFSLKYQKTLGTNKAIFNDNNVVVYRSKGTLYVNAGDTTIANIKVYDVQGKLVTELKNVKATSASIANLKATNQVLVVKITSQENTVVIKKVVN